MLSIKSADEAHTTRSLGNGFAATLRLDLENLLTTRVLFGGYGEGGR
jgi:hypothetical protein